MKVTKKLVLGKVSIVNLNNHTMGNLRGGLIEAPQNNTDADCTNVAPTTTIVTICSGGNSTQNISCL